MGEQRISIYGNGGGSPEMKPRWRRGATTVEALTLDLGRPHAPQDRWELVTSTEGHLNSQFENATGVKASSAISNRACTVGVPYTLLLTSY